MKQLDFSRVLAMPVEARIQLVQVLWDSIAEVPESLEITPAEREDLDRRLRAYREDPTSGSACPEVKARILRRA